MTRVAMAQKSFADLEIEHQGVVLDPILQSISDLLDEHGELVERVPMRMRFRPSVTKSAESAEPRRDKRIVDWKVKSKSSMILKKGKLARRGGKMRIVSFITESSVVRQISNISITRTTAAEHLPFPLRCHPLDMTIPRSPRYSSASISF